VIHRNDNRALKRDKSPIFFDYFDDFCGKSWFDNRLLVAPPYIDNLCNFMRLTSIFADMFRESYYCLKVTNILIKISIDYTILNERNI